MSSLLQNDSCRMSDLIPPVPINGSLTYVSRFGKTLLEENRSLNEEVERLRGENLQLKEDLQAQSRSFHAQLQCHKKTAEEIEDHELELDRELQHFVQREKASETAALQLRKANVTLTAELKETIEKYARECEAHQKECAEIRKQAKENELALREQLVQYKEENTTLQQCLQDMQKKCNCKESLNQALEERISELMQCNKKIRDELEQSRSSCEDREEKYAELNEKLKELQDACSTAHVIEQTPSKVCSPSPSISLFEEISGYSQDLVTSTRNGTPDMSDEFIMDPGWEYALCSNCPRLREQIDLLENMLLKCARQKLRLQEDLCRWEEDMSIMLDEKVQRLCKKMLWIS